MSDDRYYTTTPKYSKKILVQGDPDYEKCRRMNPTAHKIDRFPAEIHIPETPAEVAKALARATELGVPIGVRSSGHIFHFPALWHGGILIDAVNLNRRIDYDPVTKEICFGPSSRVEELAAKLKEVNRFFPHGHAPTVGSAGFMLAGGQGWFVRGWGATNQTWITKIEMVVPDGRTLIASRTENQDLFWAARGSGMGFFAVVTRFWGRTIERSTMWEKTLKFVINDDNYMALMSWAIERGRDTPKYGTDLNLTIDYREKYDPAYTTDDVPPNATLVLTLNNLCYTDTQREARTLLSAYDRITPEVADYLIESKPVQVRTFEEVFARKRTFLGNAGQERWSINSIMNNPDVPLARLLEGIRPAMLKLPTRVSSVFICHCDIKPDEDDACLSLPQDLYISTLTGWTDPKLEPAIMQPMRDYYRQAFPVAVGQYITDIDVNCEDANSKVMSDTALAKFLRIREKYDPKELFPTYKAFVKTSEKINKLQNKSRL
ncbi:6-hydroxy-D-nicotine oxidase [Fusarium pseudocircinatum]|uniref:6-hydroxy-D-nicotine oxidase n=1 Tax=Fusarium pseudocircinatum TaxID=56676 RepID=A0A8H5KP60_9HYPO|nr:6-hydroxy-D-nicotine oxidase [Fusarium pseudocircinatum]